MSTSARSLAILLLFNTQRISLSAAQISAAIGATLSTTYRDLIALKALGLVESVPGERYVLGGGISVLDRIARQSDPLLQSARPVLEAWSARTGYTLSLTRLYGNQLLAVDHVVGNHEVSIGYERGELLPLLRGCSGKVVLASLPWRKLKSIYDSDIQLDEAPNTLKDWKSFLAEVRGWSRDDVLWTSGEVVADNTAAAIALSDERTATAASLTVIIHNDAIEQFATEDVAYHLLAMRTEILDRLSLV